MVFFFAILGLGSSMQARNCCSTAAHPATLWPVDAQQAFQSRQDQLDFLGQCGWWEGFIPSTDVMMPTQGFSEVAFGRRTRSLGSGGRRGALSLVDAPFGGITADVL